LSSDFLLNFGAKIMKQVSMKVNASNLVKSLKFSFTNKTTVFGELMQNARRANADKVVFEFAPETKILRVTDNGCGIDSIETLLTVAESGWDVDVVAQEHPFGIGFLSALFACSHITVVSKSGRISVNTDDILSFKPVTIGPVINWDGITTITMLGIDLNTDEVTAAIKSLSRGFPIPVELNGEFIDRDYALDSGIQFIKTEIGAVHLAGLDHGGIPITNFEVFLQGLPIYSSYRHHYDSVRHVIHLDSSSFFARLPDRDCLVDEKDVVYQIRAVLAREIESYFVTLKPTISPEAFCENYRTLEHWKLVALLNDVPAVPRELLYVFSDYPVCNTEIYGECTELVKSVMSRSEIELCEVVDFIDSITEEGSALHMFAWKRNSLIFDSTSLAAEHWIHPLVRHLNEEKLTIELINKSHESQFEGHWVWKSVHFCEAYRIKIGDDVVEITDSAFFHGEENEDTIVVPKGESSGYVLSQVSSYTDNDEFQESTHTSDTDDFVSFVVANTSNDPADALRKLIPTSFNCPSLYGKSFVVTLDDHGKVTLVTVA
jgi:hypothetical protein